MRSNIRRSLTVTAVAALAITAGAAVSYAAKEVVISACVDGYGEIRIVKDASHCTSDEMPLTWNQQGPMGPGGPEGPAGPAGEDGIDVAAVQVSAPTLQWLPEDGQAHQRVARDVPAGRYAVSGRIALYVHSIATINCMLMSGNQVVDQVPVSTFSDTWASTTVPVPLSATIDVPFPMQLGIECSVAEIDATGWVGTSAATLQITRVGPDTF